MFIISTIGMAPAMYVYFFCDATVENVPLIIVLLLLSMVLSIGISLVFALVFYVMLDNENVSVFHCCFSDERKHRQTISYLFKFYWYVDSCNSLFWYWLPVV